MYIHIYDSCVDMVIWFADGSRRVCLHICKMVTPKLRKKNGLQSNDINHNTNLESDSKHQYNPATPTGDNVMPIGSTNLENTNERVFGLHDECEWQYTIVQYHTQKLNHQICALGRTTDMTCSV